MSINTAVACQSDRSCRRSKTVDNDATLLRNFDISYREIVCHESINVCQEIKSTIRGNFKKTRCDLCIDDHRIAGEQVARRVNLT